jgi:heme oxygenase
MSKLKELTWEVHQQAERTEFARKLLKGLEPLEYYRYLLNQYEIYSALENAAINVIIDFPSIARAEHIKMDVQELEDLYDLDFDPVFMCSVVEKYQNYVQTLDRDGLLAHLYVRHFGDMYGGQMIKKRNPGSGKMYEFEAVETLKQTVRAQLTDDMAEEANRCFEFAVELFKELSGE